MSSVRAVVCLVGSVAQEENWRRATESLTKRGFVVFEAGNYDKNSRQEVWDLITMVHRKKILLSKIVCVIRKPDGTLGEDTQKDVEFARTHRKIVVELNDLLQFPEGLQT